MGLDNQQVKTWPMIDKWGDHSSAFAGEERSSLGRVLNPGDPHVSILSKHPSDLLPVLYLTGSMDPLCTSQSDPGNLRGKRID
jgi:hypothetical protein